MNSKSLSAIIRLLIFVVAGLILSQLAALGLAYAFGYDIETIKELGDDFVTSADGIFIKLSLLLGHLLTFIIPSLIFAYIYYKKAKWKALKLNKALSIKYLALAFLFLVISYPAVSYSYTVNSWIPLAEWMHTNEAATAATLQKVLEMNSIGMLSFNLLLVALIPAFGEELLFRGLLQDLIHQGSKKTHLAVWIAAIAFSFFHLQFEGFLPRLLLGLVLGYSFLWTKNLWVPIILHFLNNAIPILGLYFFENDLAASDPGSGPEVAWYVGTISAILAISVGYFFYSNTLQDERA